MNIKAGLGEHILQTHNTIFLKIQWGGFEPPNPPLGTPVRYAVQRHCFWR